MSHVTQEQAKRLKELGYPQSALPGKGNLQLVKTGEETFKFQHEFDCDQPSAEELMEWLAGKLGMFSIWHLGNGEWRVDVFQSDSFQRDSLIGALYECTCWVLEGEK